MILDFESDKPIFIQIAEELENAIISGAYESETQVPSTTEISVRYKINPATVLKGVGILVDEGILYKKRGVGMFVAKGAKEKIIKKRKRQFYEKYVVPLVSEASKLDITTEEIYEMVRMGYGNEQHRS
ncbi:MAG: GntR family transcriptional regulator [Burkholderiales bacterium]